MTTFVLRVDYDTGESEDFVITAWFYDHGNVIALLADGGMLRLNLDHVDSMGITRD